LDPPDCAAQAEAQEHAAQLDGQHGGRAQQQVHPVHVQPVHQSPGAALGDNYEVIN